MAYPESTFVILTNVNRTSAETVTFWQKICKYFPSLISWCPGIRNYSTVVKREVCYPAYLASHRQVNFEHKLFKWIPIDICWRNRLLESPRNLWIFLWVSRSKREIARGSFLEGIMNINVEIVLTNVKIILNCLDLNSSTLIAS